MYLTALRPPLFLCSGQFSASSINTPAIVPSGTTLYFFETSVWFALWNKSANIVVFHGLTVLFQAQTFRWLYRNKNFVNSSRLSKARLLNLRVCGGRGERGVVLLRPLPVTLGELELWRCLKIYGMSKLLIEVNNMQKWRHLTMHYLGLYKDYNHHHHHHLYLNTVKYIRH